MAQDVSYDPSQFTLANQNLAQASQYALPSLAAQETASDRIARRVAAQNAAQNRTLQNRLGAAGRGGSGTFRNGVLQNNQNAQTALATGLADLELGFADKQQQGAQLLTGIGNQYQQGGLGLGRLQNEQTALAESQRSNQANELIDFFNSFITGGNLSSTGGGRGQAFDDDFMRLMNLLFGALG